MTADRHVAGHLAVVGVHIVDSKTHAFEPIPLEQVAPAGDDKDAVTPVADAVAHHLGAGRVPDRNAVAGFGGSDIAQADDQVALNHGLRRSVQVDAIKIVLEAVGRDHRPGRGPLDENAGVHGLEVAPGATDLQALDGSLGGLDRNHAAGAISLDHRARHALQGDALVQPDRPGMNAGLQDQDIALGRCRDRVPQVAATGLHRPLSRPGRPRRGESHGESNPGPSLVTLTIMLTAVQQADGRAFPCAWRGRTRCRNTSGPPDVRRQR